MSWLGSDHSFKRCTKALKELLGLEMSPSTLRHVTLIHAGRIEALQLRQETQSYRAMPSLGAKQLIAQADGSMVCTVEGGKSSKAKRPREWKEIRLVSVQAVGAEHPLYAASFQSIERTANQWGHIALKAGRGKNSAVHIVGDGASWICQQSGEVYGDQGRFLLDYYHASEYLGAASHACHQTTPKRWLRTQQRRLKRGQAKKVLNELKDHLESESVSEEEAPVRKAYRYLSNRRTQLHYDEAIKKELPIGSGTIESGHKHVIQSRLKKAGAAWLLEHAESMARMRTAIVNESWEDYWVNLNSKAA